MFNVQSFNYKGHNQVNDHGLREGIFKTMNGVHGVHGVRMQATEV